MAVYVCVCVFFCVCDFHVCVCATHLTVLVLSVRRRRLQRLEELAFGDCKTSPANLREEGKEVEEGEEGEAVGEKKGSRELHAETATPVVQRSSFVDPLSAWSRTRSRDRDPSATRLSSRVLLPELRGLLHQEPREQCSPHPCPSHPLSWRGSQQRAAEEGIVVETRHCASELHVLSLKQVRQRRLALRNPPTLSSAASQPLNPIVGVEDTTVQEGNGEAEDSSSVKDGGWDGERLEWSAPWIQSLRDAEGGKFIPNTVVPWQVHGGLPPEEEKGAWKRRWHAFFGEDRAIPSLEPHIAMPRNMWAQLLDSLRSLQLGFPFPRPIR